MHECLLATGRGRLWLTLAALDVNSIELWMESILMIRVTLWSLLEGRPLHSCSWVSLTPRSTKSGTNNLSPLELLVTGSAHAINGEGYAIKHRPTPQRTPDSYIIEREHLGSDRLMNVTSNGKGQRYMKFACGGELNRFLSLGTNSCV